MRSSNGREKVVRRRLADGSIKEYRYASRPDPQPRVAPNTIGALIIAYKCSPEYRRLHPKSKQHYGYYLRDLEEIADQLVLEVRRRTLLAMRDAIASERGHGAGNAFIQTAGTVYSWARDRGWCDNSPIARIKALPGGHLTAWTNEQADLAEAKLPEALRRVVVLARYAGQRRGDPWQ